MDKNSTDISSIKPSGVNSASVQPPVKLNVEKIGSTSFGMLKVTLAPHQIITVEPGAMASHDPNITIHTRLNGHLFAAFITKFFGGESLFINIFSNLSSQPGTIYLTQPVPGEIIEQALNNESVFIEAGAFIARTRGIKLSVSWAGFTSWIAGEGLFRLRLSGHGRIWYGCFGAVVEKEIVGDYIVDSGHLLSYPPTVKLSLKLAAGLISSILSKEGFVLKISGTGKVLLQTRSIKGLAQWMNPKFWG